MGRDKALLPFQGSTLGEQVAHAVYRAAGSVVLVGNPSLAGVLHYPAIPDLYPGEGPLGGILAALHHTTAEWNLVTACDMPELTPEFLTTLLDAAEQSGCDVLLPAGPNGLPEPLCAVYRRSTAEPVAAEFARGIRKVTDAFVNLNCVLWTVSDLKPFQNVNTPQDWAEYAAG
jgi:molybdopterin-guanine dinucleotide biosynthesis protein A